MWTVLERVWLLAHIAQGSRSPSPTPPPSPGFVCVSTQTACRVMARSFTVPVSVNVCVIPSLSRSDWRSEGSLAIFQSPNSTAASAEYWPKTLSCTASTAS